MSRLIVILAAIAFLVLLLLAGGTSNYLSIPAYGFAALSGLVCLFPLKGTNSKRAAPACIVSAILLAAVVILRSSTSPDAYIARQDLFLILAASIIYLVFSIVVPSSRQKTRLVVLFLLVAFAQFVVGGIQFFKGQNFMPFDFLPRPDYGARASGFFRCPNFLAGYLEIAMIFGLSLACWSSFKLLGRIASGYVALMCVVGLILTGSRGGYVSAAAGIVAFAFIWVKLAAKPSEGQGWYFKGGCALLVSVCVAFAFNYSVRKSEFLEYRIESVNTDFKVRAAMANAALRQFSLSPWFGTGSRTYLYYGREFRDPMVQRDPIFAHNDYFQFLAEYGLVGIAGLALFLGAHLRQGWKTMSQVASEAGSIERTRTLGKRSRSKSAWHSAWRSVADDERKLDDQRKPAIKRSHALALTIAAFCSVVACMAHSLVDFNMHVPANACVMAFVFAILASPGNVSSAGKHAQPLPTKANWLPFAQKLPAALGLWLIVAALPKWPGEYYAEKARRLLSDWRMLDSIEFATQADAVARKGLGYDPKNPELYYCLGEAQVLLADFAENANDRKRHFEESIEAYKSALNVSPRDVRFLLLLGASLDEVERFEEAEEAFALALKLDPASWKVHSGYALHLEKLNKLERAEVEYALAHKLANVHSTGERLERVRKRIEAQKTAPAPVIAPEP